MIELSDSDDPATREADREAGAPDELDPEPGRRGRDELLESLGEGEDERGDEGGDEAAGPDIVAKIRADQDELVRTPADTLLVIEGGPGTGKTMTALQRVAWLLDDQGVPASEVLVVGPSAAFARYTREVLESWGHARVEHRALSGLLPVVAVGGDEAPYVNRLKGEARMAGLLSRALDERQGRVPEKLPRAIEVDGRAVPIDPASLRHVTITARASEATPGDRRRILRAVLAAASDDPRLVLAAADRLADLLWPDLTPAGFLSDLFTSRERLISAAGDEFTDREISALHRPAAESPAGEVWSDADLPLLDEAHFLLHGDPLAYAHVVVDEAQDLSPMQARAVSRRSAGGAMTIVGDMAQSTGPWARDDWHDLLAHLPAALPRVHRELRFGYRVPRQIFDLAAELLPTAAPSVQAPTTVRDGPAEPSIRPVEAAERAGAVVAAAMDHVAEGRSVAIICPARCRDEIEAWLREEDLPWRLPSEDQSKLGITLLSPHDAKGLEFDAAVVVEPGFIVDDDPRGHRLLYIALTRATGHLHLVGAADDLPADLTAGPPPPLDETRPETDEPVEMAEPEPEPLPEVELAPAVREAVEVVAHKVAETLLSHLTPELWPIALERVVELITPDRNHDY